MTQDQDVLVSASGAHVQPESGEPDTGRARVSGRPRHAVRGRTPWWALVLSVLAVVLWVAALPSVDVGAINGWGLLSGLPFVWYLAYLLALATLIATLLRPTPEAGPRRRFTRVARAAWVPPLVALTLILFATTAVAYDVARSASTYKHLGVAEYLLDHGTPNRDIDIYQNFPGFFYLMDFVHLITRLPLMVMARWSETVFTLLNAAAVYWAVGALTRSLRLRAATAVIFTLANWIGQTYFAPQALAFPLSLVVLGAFLRMVAHGHGRPMRAPTLRELRACADLSVGRVEQSVWGRPTAAVVGLVVSAVIVVSHQFTPVALLVQIGLLTAVLRLRRPWLFPVMVVMEALWLLTAYPYLAAHFSFFQSLEFENLLPPTTLVPALPGAALMGLVPRMISVLIAVATLAGLVRAVRQRRRVNSVVVPVVLAIAPLLFVAVQPYGQEGILRAYLFALPWAAFLIARDLLRIDEMSRAFTRATVIGTAALVGVLGLLVVPATLGNEMNSHVWPADVAADRWFEQNAPVGSELLVLGPNQPARSTGDYDKHVQLQNPLNPHKLSDLPTFAVASRSSDGLIDLTDQYVRRRSAAHEIYLSVGPTQQAYLRLVGLVSEQTYAGYLDGLKHDPNFTLVYDQGGSFLFKVN